ncbi:hypothetical protein [Arthrobacter sp. JCM 19049]|uniref:hypothetical protein n=1 Tax=Arthrobacter sp. JCM 19049 TaxID=1460643 RepID=UPI000AF44C2B|nr:hypothetical protein [Arthrobacter sp. JCM 19049]
MVRSWAPAAVRKALGKEGMHTLADLEPKHTCATAEAVLSELQAMGFAKQDTGMDFAAGQPEYVARIDCMMSRTSRWTRTGCAPNIPPPPATRPARPCADRWRWRLADWRT